MTRTTWSANRVRSGLIDDSYVEALMVPFRDSLTGRLTTRSTRGMRVYSFGTSSSALSN